MACTLLIWRFFITLLFAPWTVSFLLPLFISPSEGDVAYTQCCTARKLSDVYSTLALLAIVFGALLRFISVYVAGRRHF